MRQPQAGVELQLVVLRLHMAAQLIKSLVVILLFQMRQFMNHNAESLMRKSWEVTFDLNPKLLTHPEQVKVLRFALKPHLEFLKTLDEVLAESSDESSKTA